MSEMEFWTALVVVAFLLVIFVPLMVVLCRGHVEFINFFPQDPATISEKDRKSMGKAVAGLMAFILVFALFCIFAPALAKG